MLRKKGRVGLKPMLDPFRIVKPIQGQDRLDIAECCTELFCLPLHTFALHHFADLSVVDAHGKGVHPDRPLPVDQELAEVVVDSEDTEYASEEVLRVVDRMESYKVSSKDALQDLPAHSCGYGTEDVIGGKGSVEEEADG